MKLFRAYTKYESVNIIADNILNAARKFAVNNGGFLIEDSIVCLDDKIGWTSYKYYRLLAGCCATCTNKIEYSFQIKEMEVII